MPYHRLYIKNCKHLSPINNLESIDMDLSNPMQIIIGCNGSGKSTLLRELATLYADSSDYYKDGVKIVELTKNDIHYTISADFTRSKVHSFMKDDVELNGAGKITAQKTLIQEEIGLDDELVRLILGKVKLTELGPNKRKEWITRMSDVDMTYAIAKHKQIATATRDIKGTLSYLGGRIANTAHKLNEITSGQGHDEMDVDKLKDEINWAIDGIGRSKHGQDDLKSSWREMKAAFHELEILANDHVVLDKQIMKAQMSLDVADIYDRESMVARIESLKEKMHQYRALIDDASADERAYSEKEKQLSQSADRETVERSLIDTPNKMKTINDRRKYPIPPSQCVDVQWPALRGELLEAISNIPENIDNELNRRRLAKLREEIPAYVSNKLNPLRDKLGHVRMSLQRIDSIENTTCPVCEYSWKQGVDVTQRDNLIEQHSALESEIVAADVTIQAMKEEQWKIEEYAHSLGRLMDLKSKYPLGLLIEALTTDGYFGHDSNTMYRMANDYIDSGIDGVELAQLEKDYEEALKNAELMKQKDQYQSGHLDAIRSKLDRYVKEVQDVEASYHAYRSFLDMIIKEESISEAIKQAVRKANDAYTTCLDALKTIHYRDVISSHNSTISEYENKRKELDSLESILEDLTKSKDQQEAAYERHLLLTRLLSPTQGIIARSVGGFLSHVTDRMNDILQDIFTYDLQILPCKFEADGKDLDYRFPLVVGASNDPSPDIKTASDGQAEIINFAFRLVAMRQLGLDDFPLFLDEFGRTLDEQHQNNAVSYIKLLLDGEAIPQVFMISHYASHHGSFLQADVCVTNGTNITVPDHANSHVVIT